MKPLELLKVMLAKYGDKTKNIVDPFCGSGTTVIASEILKKRCFAMELSENYCDTIVKRYINYVKSSKSVSLVRDGRSLSFEYVFQDFDVLPSL